MSQWLCPNCGEEMPEYLSLKHYMFCAISTPPQNQPFRNGDSFNARMKQLSDWFKKKSGIR